jgi:hypothetical protein
MKITKWTPRLWEYSATIDGDSMNDQMCDEASEEEGYVVCAFFSRTERGGIEFLCDQDGNTKTYTRHGTVVVTPP